MTPEPCLTCTQQIIDYKSDCRLARWLKENKKLPKPHVDRCLTDSKKCLEEGIAHARGELKLKTRELRGLNGVPTQKGKNRKERE